MKTKVRTKLDKTDPVEEMFNKLEKVSLARLHPAIQKAVHNAARSYNFISLDELVQLFSVIEQPAAIGTNTLRAATGYPEEICNDYIAYALYPRIHTLGISCDIFSGTSFLFLSSDYPKLVETVTDIFISDGLSSKMNKAFPVMPDIPETPKSLRDRNTYLWESIVETMSVLTEPDDFRTNNVSKMRDYLFEQMLTGDVAFIPTEFFDHGFTLLELKNAINKKSKKGRDGPMAIDFTTVAKVNPVISVNESVGLIVAGSDLSGHYALKVFTEHVKSFGGNAKSYD